MAAIYFGIFVICFITLAALLLEVALSNLKEDIIEEVLDRLEVEDDER